MRKERVLVSPIVETKYYCPICNAIVANGDKRKIVVKTAKIENKKFIHTSCVMDYLIKNNEISSLKDIILSAFKPLLNYNADKKILRSDLESVLCECEEALAKVDCNEEKKTKIMSELFCFCKDIVKMDISIFKRFEIRFSQN